MDIPHFINAGLFFLAWWAICLICIGFSLTVLTGSIMILYLGKMAWRLIFPKKFKFYSPED